MLDQYGRNIDYLRISITDRCNLRCSYCMPEGVPLSTMDDLLTFEEIREVASAAASLGIRHIKLTGGEPLVRRGIVSLVKMLKETEGIEHVTLTTNGTMLEKHLDGLVQAGLDAVNISLDSIDRGTYQRITGTDALETVLRAIDASCRAGIRTKINAVSLDLEEREWKGLVELAKDYPGLIEDTSFHGFGPAVYYRIPGYQGSVGLISAIHGKFCNSCNRVRVTSEGYLKTCLCFDEGADLREILRMDVQEEEKMALLKGRMRETIFGKPREHCFENPKEITEGSAMISIGG